MSTLHTVNKSPFSTQSLLSCLAHCKEGDAVLLIEDGIYGGLEGSALSQTVKESSAHVSLYVLGEDASARGIDPSRLLSAATVVDYGGFVDLVANHDRTQAWL